MNISLSTTFLREVYQCPKEIQNQFFSQLDKLKTTTTNGMNLEKMYQTNSGKSIYSLRVNDRYRCLVHLEGNTVFFLKIPI